MDRPIDADVQRQRTLRRAETRRRWSPCWRPRCSGCLASCAVDQPAGVRTAIADAGPIEAVITATGTVVPEVEQVVSSPVDARVCTS